MQENAQSICKTDSLMDDSLPCYGERNNFFQSSSSERIQRSQSPRMRNLIGSSPQKTFKGTVLQSSYKKVKQIQKNLIQQRKQILQDRQQKNLNTLIIKKHILNEQRQRQIQQKQAYIKELQQLNEDLLIMNQQLLVENAQIQDEIQVYQALQESGKKNVMYYQQRVQYAQVKDLHQTQMLRLLAQSLCENSKLQLAPLKTYLQLMIYELEVKNKALEINIDIQKRRGGQYDQQNQEICESLTPNFIKRRLQQLDDQIQNEINYQKELKTYNQRLEQDVGVKKGKNWE